VEDEEHPVGGSLAAVHEADGPLVGRHGELGAERHAVELQAGSRLRRVGTVRQPGHEDRDDDGDRDREAVATDSHDQTIGQRTIRP
jgi:hypothetical protein